QCYRDLALVSRDGMNIVLNKINHILMEKYLKLQDTCRTQQGWQGWERALPKSHGPAQPLFPVDFPGGDVTAKNIWLAENVLEILTEQRYGWEPPAEMGGTFLPFSHSQTRNSQLLLQVLARGFLPSLLPSLTGIFGDFPPLFPQFMDCFMIGRDLVRLLQNVARIPEFEQLWKDILHNPQVLSSQFTGVLQLLQSRTSRKFLACRLTPDMETKLLFMTSRV
ncbi:INT3 protein, partial [Sylvietta virens]|nr:INT3 protein [Sylvietta virens]